MNWPLCKLHIREFLNQRLSSLLGARVRRDSDEAGGSRPGRSKLSRLAVADFRQRDRRRIKRGEPCVGLALGVANENQPALLKSVHALTALLNGAIASANR